MTVPVWATPPVPTGAPVWAGGTSSVAPSAPPKRKPGATGFGAILQTLGDLTNSGPADHDPNSLEKGIMGLSDNKFIANARGNYKAAVSGGLFMQPVRGAMQGLGVGMDTLRRQYPGQAEAWYKQKLNERYNQAVLGVRQDAQTEIENSKAASNNRVGQATQAGLGFAANVVANPQYLLVPGMSVGGNVATRIGTAALSEAAVGSASDGAAQLMDVATKTKKDFDVQQNLENTLLSAGFGGGARSLHEVTPFIKQLFSQRGMDTTPGPRPGMGAQTPTTGQTVSLSSEDAPTLKGLLKTGSVDDIQGFLATKQGPKPTWADVNAMVKFRDSLPEQFVGRDNLRTAVDRQTSVATKAIVEDHIQNQMSGWKNAPEVEVHDVPNSITDPKIRAQALADDADGSALGFLGSDGKIRIFSDRIPDADTANAVLYHEGLGHFGLAEQFGGRLDQVINSLLKRNVSQFSRDTAKWMKANPGAYGGNRIRAGEEVLAEASQKGVIKKSWQAAVTSSVRQFGRKMGLDLAYSDEEIKHILSMAHDAVINGKPGAAANGFRGAAPDPENPNRFMFTGAKAKGFDPESPTAFRGNDGDLRNEISDSGAKFKGQDDMHPGEYTLKDVLDHEQLYKEYPELRNTKVRVHTSDEMEPGQKAYYDTEGPTIGLRTDATVEDALHEIQHGVQHTEGRITGDEEGTTHMSDEDYSMDPREVEARSTEGRRSMSLDERTQNVPEWAQADQKAMKRSQLAADPEYTASHLDEAYKALDEDYVPTTRTWEEDRRDALAAGFKPSQIKDLKTRDPGELSTRLRRMQSAANMTDIRLSELDAKLDTPDWTMKDQAEYVKALADFNYLVTRIKGEKTELGRALNASKAARSYTNATMAEIGARLEQEGSGLSKLADDPEAFLKFARQLKKLRGTKNPAGINNMLQGVNKPYWEQYLTSFHFNAMLSGLGTHIKAPLDMMTGISHNIIDHALAMPIGKMYNLVESLTGQTVKPGVSSEEMAARIGGVLRSVFDHEVYKATLHVAKTGDNGVVMPGTGFTSKSQAQTYAGVQNPRLGILSKPTDLIVAEDTFFRSVAMSETLYGLGTREARIQLKKAGQPFTMDDTLVLGASLARNPTPSMLKEAEDVVEKTLLLNHNPLTNWIDKVKSIRPNATLSERVTSWAANNLAPFIRVAANSMITRTFERSPAAFLSPKILSTIAKGGPEAHTALARIAYGTTLMGLYWNAADKITGNGPDNKFKKKELEAGGWRSNAVKDGDQYQTGGSLAASLNPFDVHNTTATMVANLRRAYEKGANQGQVAVGLKLALGSLISYMTSQSWVNSVAPAVDAATADGSAGYKVNQFVGNEAKSFVPNILNQIGRIDNPNRVDTRTPTDDLDPTNIVGSAINNVKSALPGLNKTLPTQYSVYGDPVDNGQSILGARTGVPGLNGNAVTATKDPTEIELQRLSSLIDGALITPVQRSITRDGETKHLTPEEFQEYQRVAGRAIVERVKELMSTPEWQDMSDQDKVLAVRDIQTDMKKAARESLFYNDDEETNDDS